MSATIIATSLLREKSWEMNKYTNYTMRFNLTGFIGSRVERVENADGAMERGVFIPIEDNALYEDPKTHHMLCHAFVTAKQTFSSDGKTHYIKQKVSTNHVRRIEELGYKVPALGHMWLNTKYRPSYQTQYTEYGRVKYNQE